MVLLILKYVIGVQNSESSLEITYVFIGIAILNLLLHFFLYRKKMDAINLDKTATIDQKLKEYKGAFMLKITTLNGLALIGAILHYLFGNPIIFYMSLAFIFMLILQRPTEDKIVAEMGLKF